MSERDATVHLIARYREGDQEALDCLYERYYDRLHAVVRMRMGARLRAKAQSLDLVQDAFLASLHGVDRFEYRSEGDFFHWLCRVAENRIRDQADYYKAQRRDPGRERPLEVRSPSGDSALGPLKDLARFTRPDQRAARAEEVLQLEQAMDDLAPEQREAVLLVRYEGLSLAEAAEVLDRSPDAVRMLVARGVVALGKRMQRSRPEE